MPKRFTTIFASITLAVALALGAYSLLWPHDIHAPTVTGEALVGGPFSMIDQDGRKVTEKDFLGSYMLVFFGYTYCPDVCPTELQVMSAAMGELGRDAQKVRLVFVTIDPDRDTPEVMKSYVGSFATPITGLTGSAADVAAIAKAYRVFYQKVPGGKPEDYAMDHSSIVYLMGPDGKFLKHFTYTTDAKALAEALRAVLSGSS